MVHAYKLEAGNQQKTCYPLWRNLPLIPAYHVWIFTQMSKTNLPATLFGSDSYFQNCWTPYLYCFNVFIIFAIFKSYSSSCSPSSWTTIIACSCIYHVSKVLSWVQSTSMLFLHAHIGGQSQKSCGRDGRPTLGKQSWILLFWNICPDWRWNQLHVSGKSVNFICKYAVTDHDQEWTCYQILSGSKCCIN